ncbi:hypothetical protein GCM10008097_16780 [Mycetocola manganoxydans]|nr:hypothetical protein GCM10008097_16780 [Mycetocola manganoxydans]
MSAGTAGSSSGDASRGDEPEPPAVAQEVSINAAAPATASVLKILDGTRCRTMANLRRPDQSGLSLMAVSLDPILTVI